MYKFPLLPPRLRHRPRQLLQLHTLCLPPLQDRFLDIRRQQREPQQPADEAAIDLLGLGNLRDRAALPCLQASGSTGAPGRACGSASRPAAAELTPCGVPLRAPANLSILYLLPYSPELNPQENIWQYLRQTYLSNKLFETHEDVVDARCKAWTAFLADVGRVNSIATQTGADIGQQFHWLVQAPDQRAEAAAPDLRAA